MKTINFLILVILTQVQITAQNKHKTITISDELKLVQLTENVWVHVSTEVIRNFGRVASNGVIYTEKGKAFLFDTPVTDSLTEVLVKVISDSLKVEVIGFVPNHWHEDCIGGMNYLKKIGIKSYANQMTIDEARKHKRTAPENGFNQSLSLKLCEKPIECWYPGPGHSTDNIVVWLPDEKVLFAGCMCKEMKSEGIGNLSDADLKKWSGTLEKVLKKFPQAQFVVPGHGQWGGTELLQNTIKLIIKNS